MIICLGTTPAVQRVMQFQHLELDHVNRAIIVAEGPAGKFINAGKVLRQIGGDPFVLGFAGGKRGQYLRQELLHRGVAHELVEVSKETRLCTTVIDQGGGTATELVEESAPASPEEFGRLLQSLRANLGRARGLVLSGTVAPGGPPDFYAQCCALALEFRVPCIVDAQGRSLLDTLKNRPAVVKPNKSELEKTVGRNLPDEASIVEAMQELLRLGAGAVVVTRGPAPVLAVERAYRGTWRITSPSIDALNPIGSGDAFTAGLAYGYCAGQSLGEACSVGVAAGAANALTLMPGELRMEDFQRLRPQVLVEKLG